MSLIVKLFKSCRGLTKLHLLVFPSPMICKNLFYGLRVFIDEQTRGWEAIGRNVVRITESIQSQTLSPLRMLRNKFWTLRMKQKFPLFFEFVILMKFASYRMTFAERSDSHAFHSSLSCSFLTSLPKGEGVAETGSRYVSKSRN